DLSPFSVAVITRPRCKCPRCSPSLLAGLPKEKRRRPLPHAATDFINWSLANRRLQFHKRRQPFIRSHSEMLSAAAMRSCMRTSLASLAAKQDSWLQARAAGSAEIRSRNHLTRNRPSVCEIMRDTRQAANMRCVSDVGSESRLQRLGALIALVGALSLAAYGQPSPSSGTTSTPDSVLARSFVVPRSVA